MSNDFDTLDSLPTIRGDNGAESKLLTNRYRIIRKLGEGGMGMVYLAEDTELDNNKVAIKFIPPALAGNARAIKSLKKEAQTAMQLSHPNIVRLHDLHTDGHQKFLVMEYIEGKTLEQVLAEKQDCKLMLKDIVPIAEQVATALDYAHTKHVLHRDLKPSNVMIDKSGTAKILDFGVAREIKDSYTRVTGKETSGTLPYMSPEQLRGQPPSPAMDIYSFTAVLYECLSGHPPFYMGDIRYQILNESPARVADLPDSANDVLLSALSKQTSDRPNTAIELASTLGSFVGRDARPKLAPVKSAWPKGWLIPLFVVGLSLFIGGLTLKTWDKDQYARAIAMISGGIGALALIPIIWCSYWLARDWKDKRDLITFCAALVAAAIYGFIAFKYFDLKNAYIDFLPQWALWCSYTSAVLVGVVVGFCGICLVRVVVMWCVVGQSDGASEQEISGSSQQKSVKENWMVQ